jgi:hypothetical protein
VQRSQPEANLIEQLGGLRTRRFIGHDNPHKAMGIHIIQWVEKTVMKLSKCVASLLDNPVSLNWRCNPDMHQQFMVLIWNR